MNYAKGEWEAVGRTVRDSEHIEICVCSTYQESPNANAHLIAAAPDMYEALKIELPWAKEWIRYLRNTVGQGQGQNADEQFVIADKALAKAEGREDGNRS